MNIDDLVKLIDSVTKLLGVFVWPAVLIVVLVKFAPALKDFFYSLGEFSLKGAGFEATAKRKQAEVTAALVAASVSRPDAATTPESAARNANEAAAVVADTVNARIIRRATAATALWVDDRPANNVFERQALEALGVSFVLATSTEEALKLTAKQRFDVIISDMGRPPDPHAGYTLLDKLRGAGDKTPFIIYAGSNAPEHKAEARSRGAMGSTNRAAELFQYVIAALNTGS
ncbi:response regulator [Variovorax sp. YR216]|uniref:response regulator n=1 Tax=Variovorax sp. YR216 TaxID=1882828 RepID=UPI00089BB548|nr:response regulator [Variovorax sp. YR216]SEA50596.1 Response regulator receiver domain-containing protein [Variovorax sp. YR216]